MLYAGSLVFTPPGHPVDLKNWGEWWSFMKGANWRHPYGPKSNIQVLDNHPVVHVAFADALAYAKWAGKDLPTEAEWEFAARGGLDGAEFAWGDDFTPGGQHRANTWQGNFPHENKCEDGFDRTSPVMAFPPNRYGVYDMIGNVWEWTADWWSAKHEADTAKPCCVPQNSEHCPMYVPGLSACNQMWLGWPGTFVILRVSFGTQNSCSTSFDSSRTDNGLPAGI